MPVKKRGTERGLIGDFDFGKYTRQALQSDLYVDYCHRDIAVHQSQRRLSTYRVASLCSISISARNPTFSFPNCVACVFLDGIISLCLSLVCLHWFCLCPLWEAVCVWSCSVVYCTGVSWAQFSDIFFSVFVSSIGHFRVVMNLIMKARLSAKLFIGKLALFAFEQNQFS